MNTWILALLIYNNNKSYWCIPKKYTLQYNDVLNIKTQLENDYELYNMSLYWYKLNKNNNELEKIIYK